MKAAKSGAAIVDGAETEAPDSAPGREAAIPPSKCPFSDDPDPVPKTAGAPYAAGEAYVAGEMYVEGEAYAAGEAYDAVVPYEASIEEEGMNPKLP